MRPSLLSGILNTPAFPLFQHCSLQFLRLAMHSCMFFYFLIQPDYSPWERYKKSSFINPGRGGTHWLIFSQSLLMQGTWHADWNLDSHCWTDCISTTVWLALGDGFLCPLSCTVVPQASSEHLWNIGGGGWTYSRRLPDAYNFFFLLLRETSVLIYLEIRFPLEPI